METTHLMQLADHIYIYIPQFGPFSRFHLNSHRAKIPKTKNLEDFGTRFKRLPQISPPLSAFSASFFFLFKVEWRRCVSGSTNWS